MDDLLSWVQDMYLELCNGDWEHTNGFVIDNIDNPGWSFDFDVKDLVIEEFPFEPVEVQRSETDWYSCKIENGVFTCIGGAKNLIDIISVFKKWYIEADRLRIEKYGDSENE